MEDNFGFSERLKVAMEFRGKKAIEVADGCGLQRGTISLYLHNKRIPKKENIFKIADYLQVNRGFLLGLSNNVVIVDVENGTYESETEEGTILADINNMCSKQDLEALRKIYNVIKAITK